MSDHAINVDRVFDLTGAICDDCASQDDLVELDSIVIADEVSGRHYWNYCRMHVMLRMEARVHRALQAVHERGKPDLTALAPWESDALFATIPATTSSVLPTTPTLFSTTFHGTIGFFSQELPFSLLIATLLTGFGLWIASLVYVSGPEKIAKDSSSPMQSSFDPTLEIVGKITGMVDCKWADPNTAAFHGANVLLGRKYALASGLMEITYDTGAKVILQGPVTYEVESKNGGFLPVGKLTGKVEVEAAKGFSVRTPSATVTDLGTEFGVEASDDGVTEIHVFVGQVQITTNGSGSNSGKQSQVISAEQSVRVGHDNTISVSKEATTNNAKRFVRVMPTPVRRPIGDDYAKLVLSLKPVVYYRMEEWPRDERQGGYVLVDSAPGAHHGELHVDRAFGPPWHHGKFGGVLEFRGSMLDKHANYAIVRDYPKADNGQLSVSAWVRPIIIDQYATIVQNFSQLDKTGPTTGQFYLGVIQANGPFYLSAIVRERDGREVYISKELAESPVLTRGKWHHVAFVADGAMLRLYWNGVELGAGPCLGVAVRQNPKGLGIGCLTEEVGAELAQAAPGPWNGCLDEIAIFNHALGAEQVRQLYTGSPMVVKPSSAMPTAEKN